MNTEALIFVILNIVSLFLFFALLAGSVCGAGVKNDSLYGVSPIEAV